MFLGLVPFLQEESNYFNWTFDLDGEINADGGNVEFTDAGSLNLSSTVTSLGTFTWSTSTVTYDGTSDQMLILMIIIIWWLMDPLQNLYFLEELLM